MLTSLALAAAVSAAPTLPSASLLIPASAPGYQFIGRFQHAGDTSMFDMPVSRCPPLPATLAAGRPGAAGRPLPAALAGQALLADRPLPAC